MADAPRPSLFEIPEPGEIAEVRLPDGDVTELRRHGNPDGPRLLVSHGNGLAVDLYYPLWGRLTDEFDVVVFDLRNHGRNRVGEIARHHVPQCIADLDQVASATPRCFGEKPCIGVYHSLSALSALLSPSRGEAYAGLFLFDPPVCKPGHTYLEFDAAIERAVRRTRRRQEWFESPAHFAELLEFFILRRAVPGMAQLAARTLLRGDEDGGGVVLRCPREYEARIIEYVTAFAVLVEFETMRCPVKVLGSDPTVPFALIPSFNLAALMECDYDFVPEAGHLLFLERPDLCAQRVREFAVACGLLPA